jgi:hypothetical protein
MNSAKGAEPAWTRLHTKGPTEGAAVGVLPPRSRLYCLAPAGTGTAKVECLTSYINRPAWKYRVGPRVLVAQEILPQLRGAHYVQAAPNRLGSFGRSRSMSINGQGEVARAWAEAIETLTMRTDLPFLTLRAFASGLPNWGLQRASPAWCAACYQEWREAGQPIYQPLVWMLQAVTVCLRHQQWLTDRCPRCSQPQSALAAKTPPGFCTQCQTWLGLPPGAAEEVGAETPDWQRWVWEVIEELLLFSRVFGAPL